MSTMFRTPLSNWIRGAQTVFHEGSMFIQSLFQTFLFGLVFLAIGVVWTGVRELDPQERHIAIKSIEAGAKVALYPSDQVTVSYTAEDGVKHDVVDKALAREGDRGVMKFCGVRIPHKFEASHFVIIGAPSTGKTVQILEMLLGIRDASKRAPARIVRFAKNIHKKHENSADFFVNIGQCNLGFALRKPAKPSPVTPIFSSVIRVFQSPFVLRCLIMKRKRTSLDTVQNPALNRQIYAR